MIDISVVRAAPRTMSAAQEAINQASQAAVTDIADRIVAGAQEAILTNRDPARALPSRLAQSISRVDLEPGQVLVQASAPYAAAVEFGTVHRPADPFMAPAVAAVREGDLVRGARL